jgi:hypothetical protein
MPPPTTMTRATPICSSPQVQPTWRIRLTWRETVPIRAGLGHGCNAATVSSHAHFCPGRLRAGAKAMVRVRTEVADEAARDGGADRPHWPIRWKDVNNENRQRDAELIPLSWTSPSGCRDLNAGPLDPQARRIQFPAQCRNQRNRSVDRLRSPLSLSAGNRPHRPGNWDRRSSRKQGPCGLGEIRTCRAHPADRGSSPLVLRLCLRH